MISFIVPAFNEEISIKSTIYTINEAISEVRSITNYKIIIVNDGSLDSTQNKILELKKEFKNIVNLNNHNNSGLGFSIRKALEFVEGKKFMIVPGDNAFSKEAIVMQLQASLKSDLVIPYPINLENRRFWRRSLSKIYCKIYSIFLNINVSYINGTTIYPTNEVRKLKLVSNGHSIVSEITTKLLHKKILYCEVPIKAIFPKRERKIKLRNFINVVLVFLILFFEIKIINKKKYNSNLSRRVNFY